MPRQHFAEHFEDRKRHQRGHSLFRMFHAYLISQDVTGCFCPDVNPLKSPFKLIRFLFDYFLQHHHHCSSSNLCDQLLHNSHTVYDKLLHTYRNLLFLKFQEILSVFGLGLVEKEVVVSLGQAKCMVSLHQHRNLVSPNLLLLYAECKIDVIQQM